MFRRSALSSAIVLAGSVWGSAALANTDSGAQFSSADEINKVSEWMGKEVQDNEGNDVGEISDFALNLEDGSITYAVVELGGMFSSDSIAVPLSALKTSAEGQDELTLQVSQSEWKSAETFSSDWPLQASLGAGAGGADTTMPTDGTNETTDTGWQQSEDAYGQTEVQTEDEYGQSEQQVGQTEDQYGESTDSISGVDQGADFDSLDSDGDGYLTPEEYQSVQGATASDGTDEDQDGRVSRSEFAAFEASEQESSGMRNDSSTDDRFGESADHSYDSQETDDDSR